MRFTKAAENENMNVPLVVRTPGNVTNPEGTPPFFPSKYAGIRVVAKMFLENILRQVRILFAHAVVLSRQWYGKLLQGTPILCSSAQFNTLLAIILASLLLTACGEGGYWTLTNAPLPVKHIVRADYPCAIQGARACWNPASQTIELKHGLSPSDEACAMRHEKAHAAGWTHPVNQAIIWDCGPKEFLETA